MPDWGISASGTNAFVGNWCRAMGGTFPNVDNMFLRRVAILVGTTHSAQARLAVYSGGNLTTGPAGATLLKDFGVTSGSATGTWLEIEVDSIVFIPKNTVTWIAFRNNGGFTFQSFASSPGGSSFQTARGRWNSVAINGDETSTYPSTWPSDSSGAFADFWYSVLLVYAVRHYGGLLFDFQKLTSLSSVTTFLPPAQATVCFWVNFYYVIFLQRIIGNANNWEILLETTGQIVNDLRQGVGRVTSIASLFDSTVYHITCTVDNSGNAQIFINGILDNSGTQNDGTPGTDTLQIGIRPGAGATEYMSGYIEDVRIYNRVLSANEVATIYGCKGIDGIVHGLLHRWLLNEGVINSAASGTGSIKDIGPGQLNMTPNNGPLYSGSQLKFKRVG